MKRFALLALLAYVALPVDDARAATNLPMVCTNPAEAGKPVNQACGGPAQTGQVYRVPLDTDLVRVRSDGAQVADWTSTAYVWLAWKDLAQGRLYDVCKTDVAPGSSVPDGTCTDWGMVPRANAQPTIAVSPASGVAPLDVTVTWNVPGGSSCQAGGRWAGPKPLQGSEVVKVTATGAAAFSLTCSLPGPFVPIDTRLQWTAPTQNTDGTAYTNPGGYAVYHGKSSPPPQVATISSPATVTYTLPKVAPGPWWFGVDAVNTAGVRSELFSFQSTVIGQASTTPWTGTATSTVSPPTVPVPAKPKAPVLTITEVPSP
jgi:hypothetical protein